MVSKALLCVEDITGRRYTSARDQWIARMPTAEEAVILELPTGAPVMHVVHTARDDACTVLSAQELASIQLPPESKPLNSGSEAGCTYKSERYIVDFAVDRTRTVDGYLAGAQNYLKDSQNSVNSRRGALVQSAEGGCTQFWNWVAACS